VSGPVTITPRLRQLLLLLSSDQPGEVTAAAAAIGRTLRAAGTDWHALANGLLAETPQPKSRHQHHGEGDGDGADGWEAMREFCAGHSELLRSREAEFIESLAEWRGRPTEKQMGWLCAIYARLRRQTA
jgi:hypothetical protein